MRILRLLLGMWSPSLVALIQGRDAGEIMIAAFERREPVISPISWLDRWELRNHRRDMQRLGAEMARGAERGVRRP